MMSARPSGGTPATTSAPSRRPDAAQRRRLKLCVGASAGGHLCELLAISAAWQPYSPIFVSTLPLVEGRLSRGAPVYILGECNRQQPLRTLVVFFRALRLMWRERPDAVLTTGSFPLALTCLAAKLFRAKVIWIDSVANVDGLSASGRLVKRFADLFFTQWESVGERHDDVECLGPLV